MEDTSSVRDKDFEKFFYQSLLEEQPDFAEALDCLGCWYTKNGDYEKGLELDLHLVNLKPEDPYAWYNLACSYSRLGSLAEALNSIKRAVCCGYDDTEHMLADEDLQSLRVTEEFKKFFIQINSKDDIQDSIAC